MENAKWRMLNGECKMEKAKWNAIMRFKKIYIEITNICNLSCAFCKKTSRAARFMSIDEFQIIIKKIKPYTAHVYLHLMGEPLLHKGLNEILKICAAYEINVNITTNGTLINQSAELLQNNKIRQINFSIHDIINSEYDMDEYLNNILSFSLLASKKTYINLRLWNYTGGDDRTESVDEAVINKICIFFGLDNLIFEKKKGHGTKIHHNIFLQLHDRFVWPELGGRLLFESGRCYALRDHIGILADGTVVPCCLDSDGCLALGNIHNEDLGCIINSPMACEIYNGFKERRVIADLCKTCGFASKL